MVLKPDGSVCAILLLSGSMISTRRSLLKFVKSLSLYNNENFFWEFKLATSIIFFFSVPNVIFLSTSKFTSLKESAMKQFSFTFDDGRGVLLREKVLILSSGKEDSSPPAPVLE